MTISLSINCRGMAKQVPCVFVLRAYDRLLSPCHADLYPYGNLVNTSSTFFAGDEYRDYDVLCIIVIATIEFSFNYLLLYSGPSGVTHSTGACWLMTPRPKNSLTVPNLSLERSSSLAKSSC